MVWRGKRRPSENTKRQMLYINIHLRDFLSQIHVCIDLLLSGRTLVTGKYGWHFSRDVTPFVWCSFFCATSCYVAKMHQFSTKPTCLGGQLPMYYINPKRIGQKWFWNGKRSTVRIPDCHSIDLFHLVLARRHSRVMLEIFSKKTLRRKVQRVRYLLHRHVWIFQQVFSLKYH